MTEVPLGDIRREFAQRTWTQRQKLFDSLVEVLDSWKEVESMKCTCGRRVKFRVADGNARVAAVKALLEQGFGKPATAPEQKAAPDLTGKRIEDLSDAELEALVAAGDVGGGEG